MLRDLFSIVFILCFTVSLVLFVIAYWGSNKIVKEYGEISLANLPEHIKVKYKRYFIYEGIGKCFLEFSLLIGFILAILNWFK